VVVWWCVVWLFEGSCICELVAGHFVYWSAWVGVAIAGLVWGFFTPSGNVHVCYDSGLLGVLRGVAVPVCIVPSFCYYLHSGKEGFTDAGEEGPDALSMCDPVWVAGHLYNGVARVTGVDCAGCSPVFGKHVVDHDSADEFACVN